MRICSEWLGEFLDKEISLESLVNTLINNGYEASIINKEMIDVELTNNRLDCFSLFGFSREVSIIQKKKL